LIKFFHLKKIFSYFTDDFFKFIIDARFGETKVKELIYLDLGVGFGLSIIDGVNLNLTV